jgi:tRNA 5-methylaminomethyl-2-thiouridine biosynthesis bifunctional protein
LNASPAQARQARLCARWQGQARVVVLQLGFGDGSDFLQAWARWQADPARCRRLIYVAIVPQHLTRDALAHALVAVPAALHEFARQLLQAWPPASPNLHSLSLAHGQVQLLLAMGDAEAVLPGLRLAADVLWLDEGAWSARLLASLGRKAASAAQLHATALTAAQQAHLHSAGFVFDNDAHHARFEPRRGTRSPPSSAIATTHALVHALVIGAGVAGAAVTHSLAQRGLSVTVLDQHAAPAMAASGNAAALFHGVVHGHDGHYARLLRAAALQAQRSLGSAIHRGLVPGSVSGCLRLADNTHTLSAMRFWLQAQRLPADYAQLLDPTAAADMLGRPVRHAAWFYPGGGWVAPADWVRLMLTQTAVRFVGHADVQHLARDGADWVAVDANHQELARAPVLVLANAASAQRLLVARGHAPWPTSLSRGQVSQWHDASQPPLRLPLGGDGYVLSLPGGHWLCGATRQQVDAVADDAPHAADHALNLARALRLSGITPPPGATVHGRVGWRLQAADSLPIAGPVPLAQFAATQRVDQARLLPREAGLFVLTALGSRGLTWAPLLGELVAAQIVGDPWPLEQELVDAIDPARFAVRRARGGNPDGAAVQT